MLNTTLDAFRALLKADPSVSPQQRAELLTLVRHGPHAPKLEAPQGSEVRVLTRNATAQMLNRSTRFVDRVASEGLLRKIKLPNRRRAIGFAQADVERLIAAS